jgi:NAD-dependent SIR2 family protein deacetylase
MFKEYKESMIKSREHTGKDLQPIKSRCKDCGREFEITAEEQTFASENKGFVLPKRCSDCRAMRKAQNKKLKCVSCGKEFEFKYGEQQFYRDNNLAEPKKCPVCRKIKSGGIYNGQNHSEEDKSE